MAPALSLVCLAACLESLLCLASDPWEWAGVYDFPTRAHYVWSATRNKQGAYAEDEMKLVIVAASAATDAGLHGAEAKATTLWSGSAATKRGGDAIDVQDAAYGLVFDNRTWTTHFELHVDTPGAYVIFTEHLPTELENGFHFLRTEAGADVMAAVEEGSGGHQHHSAPTPAPAPCPWTEAWEWSGVFTLPTSGYYTWNAAKGAGGSYAYASMTLVALAAPNATDAGLAHAATNAKALWNSPPVVKNTGDLLQIGGAYTLKFDDHAWVSHFLLQTSAPQSVVAFFAQHLPTEFEKEFHYLKDSTGADIEPVAQTSAASCGSASTTAAPTATANLGSWGEVIGGAIITCLPTLLGVFFLIPAVAVRAREVLRSISGVINSFASGVIFAAAVFLLLPEALHLAGSGQDEVTGAWSWGTSILVGWFTCFMIDGACKVFQSSSSKASSADNKEQEQGEDVMPPMADRMAMAVPVLLGDFFHNFSDGLVIGTAFKVCGGSFAWQLVGVTVAHEIPQELADLVILILDAKFKWHFATLANFLCSLSTVIGAIITYSVKVGVNEEGLILAYGGGVYLYVAVTELGVHIQNPQGWKGSPLVQYALQALSFAIGTVLMGLVLIGDEHCKAPASGGGGAAPSSGGGGGHNHRRLTSLLA